MLRWLGRLWEAVKDVGAVLWSMRVNVAVMPTSLALSAVQGRKHGGRRRLAVLTQQRTRLDRCRQPE